MQWTYFNLKSWYNLLTMEGSTSLKASMVLKLNMLCPYQIISFNTIILQNIVKMINLLCPVRPPEPSLLNKFLALETFFLNFENTSFDKYEYCVTA